MGQTKNIDPKNVINGTFGYLYIDGEEIAELTTVKAQDDIGYEDIDQPGHLRSGKKMISVSGTGEFGINKITNAYNEMQVSSQKLRSPRSKRIRTLWRVRRGSSITVRSKTFHISMLLLRRLRRILILSRSWIVRNWTLSAEEVEHGRKQHCEQASGF